MKVLKKLEPWLAKHRRPAWKPETSDGDSEAAASRFCGEAWVSEIAPWPECGECHQPMQLFVQLDLNDLPAELGNRFGSGLLQLFYCTRDQCQGSGGWEPFEDTLSRVRVVQPTGKRLALPPAFGGDFPAKQIVGWNQIWDLPHPEEHEELGLKYTYDFKSDTVDLDCPELRLSLKGIQDEELAERIGLSESGDKLAGWPYWVQSVEYPSCPRCRRRMHLVLQLDSDDHVPFMFGDMGCGHITQCPEHKDVVAFGWACG